MIIDGLEIFAAHGIVPKAEIMPNGESRLRLGSDYIRTLDAVGAWQNAHYHIGLQELYVVVSGWMAFAEEINGEMVISFYRAGEYVLTRTNSVHNVYLSNGTDIHTIKFGTPVKNKDKGDSDWWPSLPAFDSLTKSITETELINMLTKYIGER